MKDARRDADTGLDPRSFSDRVKGAMAYRREPLYEPRATVEAGALRDPEQLDPQFYPLEPLQPIVPIAEQEQRALIVYDFGWQGTTIALDGSGNFTSQVPIFEVEAGWEWLIDRMAIFGSGFTAGSVKIFEGIITNAKCFNIQAGNAVNGGVSAISAPAIAERVGIYAVAAGAGVSGTIDIGVWFRRARWIEIPPKGFKP